MTRRRGISRRGWKHLCEKTVNTKEEWIAGYLREKPDATGASVIADFNPIEGLGEQRLGWFSFPEAGSSH